MLVVYNRTQCSLHANPYAVLTAMRGLDVIEYQVPPDPGSPIVPVRERPGPGRKFAPEMNTSVSCIAVLCEFFKGGLIPFALSGAVSPDAAGDLDYALAVYHNRFARQPLDPGSMVSTRVKHYQMALDESSWELCPSDPSK